MIFWYHRIDKFNSVFHGDRIRDGYYSDQSLRPQ